MADQVTMTWTDTTGTYTSTFDLVNPTLADVKEAYTSGPMMMHAPGVKEASDAEFYAGMSQRLANDVMNYAQNYKHQKAMQALPPVEITEGAPPARTAPKK
jgi:hypothetical protein